MSKTINEGITPAQKGISPSQIFPKSPTNNGGQNIPKPPSKTGNEKQNR